jgi:hypothetical protein
MEDKYQNKYRVSAARLSNWDYGSNGQYFITVCTKGRRRYFGEIEGDDVTDIRATKQGETRSIASLHHFTLFFSTIKYPAIKTNSAIAMLTNISLVKMSTVICGNPPFAVLWWFPSSIAFMVSIGCEYGKR